MDKVFYEKVNCSLPTGLHTIFTNIAHIHLHWHDETEIIIVCGGNLIVNIQGNQKQLGKGDIALVSSGEIHSVNSSNDDRINSVFMLQISNQFIKGLGLDMELSRFISFPSDKEYQEHLDEIRKFLFLVIIELNKMERAYMPMIHSHCCHILSLLFRYFPINKTNLKRQEHLPITDIGQQRLKRVFTYINEHYNDNPPLDEVAAIAYLSPFYFSHFFSTVTGLTYSQYLNTIKTSMVQQDLLYSNDNVVDIMLRNGFSNTKTFNRVFKNYTGYSPSAYRKYMMSFRNENNLSEGVDKKHNKEKSISDPRLGTYVNFRNTIDIPDDLFHKYIPEEGKNEITEFFSDFPESVSYPGVSTLRNIILDTLKTHGKLDQYFCFMSAVGRAADLLRESVQRQVRTVQKEIGFKYLRFHGILNDEIGIFPPGSKMFNYTYLDEILDFLLEVNLKPFVEFSYMPGGLASGDQSKFFYNANVSIPKDWNTWQRLISSFMEHVIKRYSRKEVESWYFEVWNEPNFESDWTGSFDDYIRFYKLTVQAVKAACPDSKVGGPALSGLLAEGSVAFLKSFLEACGKEKLPLDFVSAHPYPSLYRYEGEELYETFYHPLQTREDIQSLKEIMKSSPYPEAELQLNEWNSSPIEQDLIHDTAFMAPFIIKNYLNCQGLAKSLGYWAISDFFEEHQIPKNEFHGGFGMLNKSGLKKPQYHAFVILKRLGSEIISQGEDYIITRKDDISEGKLNGIQVLVWNYTHYSERFCNGDKTDLDYYRRYNVFTKGTNLFFRIEIPAPSTISCIVEKIVFDRNHGSIFDFWLKNGALEYPSPEYLAFLSQQCLPLQSYTIIKPKKNLILEADVPPFGFVFFEVNKI